MGISPARVLFKARTHACVSIDRPRRAEMDDKPMGGYPSESWKRECAKNPDGTNRPICRYDVEMIYRCALTMEKRIAEQTAAKEARLEQQTAAKEARLEQQTAAEEARLEQQTAAEEARLEQQTAAQPRTQEEREQAFLAKDPATLAPMAKFMRARLIKRKRDEEAAEEQRKRDEEAAEEQRKRDEEAAEEQRLKEALQAERSLPALVNRTCKGEPLKPLSISASDSDRCDKDKIYHPKPSKCSESLMSLLVSALKNGQKPFVTVKMDGWFVEVTYAEGCVVIKQSNGTKLELSRLVDPVDLPPLQDGEHISFHCELVAKSNLVAHEGGFNAVSCAMTRFRADSAGYKQLKLVPFEVKCIKASGRVPIPGSQIRAEDQAALMREFFARCPHVQHLEVVDDVPLGLSEDELEQEGGSFEYFLEAKATDYVESLKERARSKGHEGYVVSFAENLGVSGRMRALNTHKVKPHVELVLQVDRESGYGLPRAVKLRDARNRVVLSADISADEVTYRRLMAVTDKAKIRVRAHGVMQKVSGHGGYYLHGMSLKLALAPHDDLSDASEVYDEGSNHHARLCFNIKSDEF